MTKQGEYLGYGVIYLKPHASSTTRLHEIFHKQQEHNPGKYSPSDFVDSEIDAESYAFRIMERPVTHRVGLTALTDLVDRFNYSPKKAVALVIDRLRVRGIPVGKDEREDLLSHV